MEIIWKLPSERMYDRIEELEEFLSNFPESPLAPAMRKELEYLESLK